MSAFLHGRSFHSEKSELRSVQRKHSPDGAAPLLAPAVIYLLGFFFPETVIHARNEV